MEKKFRFFVCLLFVLSCFLWLFGDGLFCFGLFFKFIFTIRSFNTPNFTRSPDTPIIASPSSVALTWWNTVIMKSSTSVLLFYTFILNHLSHGAADKNVIDWDFNFRDNTFNISYLDLVNVVYYSVDYCCYSLLRKAVYHSTTFDAEKFPSLKYSFYVGDTGGRGAHQAELW